MKKIMPFLFLLNTMNIGSQTTSLSEELIHSTVRIECDYLILDPSGKKTMQHGIGSGFIFSFKNGDSDTISIPVLVTNKHVITNAIKGKFQFTKSDANGSPIYGEKQAIELTNFQDYWIPHPNPAIDLCIMPIAPIINQASKKGTPIFYKSFEEKLIPSDAVWQSFTAIEEVTMIGYPIGLWDNKNNVPIVRTGQTATPLKLDYQGNKEFLVDIPAFPGSSGSPIILYNQGSYSSGNGIAIGTRLYLLGILYAGPMFNAQGTGKITIDKLPINITTTTGIPINIGVVIKSNELFELKKEIMKLIKKN